MVRYATATTILSLQEYQRVLESKLHGNGKTKGGLESSGRDILIATLKDLQLAADGVLDRFLGKKSKKQIGEEYELRKSQYDEDLSNLFKIPSWKNVWKVNGNQMYRLGTGVSAKGDKIDILMWRGSKKDSVWLEYPPVEDYPSLALRYLEESPAGFYTTTDIANGLSSKHRIHNTIFDMIVRIPPKPTPPIVVAEDASDDEDKGAGCLRIPFCSPKKNPFENIQLKPGSGLPPPPIQAPPAIAPPVRGHPVQTATSGTPIQEVTGESTSIVPVQSGGTAIVQAPTPAVAADELAVAMSRNLHQDVTTTLAPLVKDSAKGGGGLQITFQVTANNFAPGSFATGSTYNNNALGGSNNESTMGDDAADRMADRIGDRLRDQVYTASYDATTRATTDAQKTQPPPSFRKNMAGSPVPFRYTEEQETDRLASATGHGSPTRMSTGTSTCEFMYPNNHPNQEKAGDRCDNDAIENERFCGGCHGWVKSKNKACTARAKSSSALCGNHQPKKTKA